jgi:hypothetical protein
MKILKKIWKFLDNKKSAIGATVNVLTLWAFAKGKIDETDMIMISGLLTITTGVAVVDHVRKGLVK